MGWSSVIKVSKKPRRHVGGMLYMYEWEGELVKAENSYAKVIRGQRISTGVQFHTQQLASVGLYPSSRRSTAAAQCTSNMAAVSIVDGITSRVYGRQRRKMPRNWISPAWYHDRNGRDDARCSSNVYIFIATAAEATCSTLTVRRRQGAQILFWRHYSHQATPELAAWRWPRVKCGFADLRTAWWDKTQI